MKLHRCLLLFSFLLLTTGRAQTDAPEPAPELDPERRNVLLRLLEVERLVAAQPENASTLAERAQLCIQLGARTEAYSSLNRLEAITPQWPELTAMRRQTDGMENPEYEQLTACLTQSAELLIRQDLPGAAGLFHLAELLLRDMGHLKITADSLHVMRGDEFAERQRLDLARADYRAAVGTDGAITAESHVALGRALIRDGQLDAGLTELALVNPEAGVDFKFSRYWQAKAHLARHEQTHDVADAVAAYTLFNGLSDEDPHDEDYVAGRNEALELVPMAERQRLRTSSTTRLAQAAALAKEGQVADARLILDGLILRQPRLVDAYLARSMLRGDPAQSELDRSLALELGSSQPVGVSRSQEGDDFSEVDLAVHEKPYLSGPYLKRARTRLRQSSAAEIALAVADARRAVQIDAYDPEAYAVLAEAAVAQANALDFVDFQGRKKWAADATAAADRAVALAPEDLMLLVWRGEFEESNTLNDSRGKAGALRFYTRALRVDPGSRPALLARARVTRQLERYAASITDYRTYLQQVSSDIMARYELAVTQLLAAHYSDAVETFSMLKGEYPLLSGKTSAESIEFAQMRAVALAAAGEEEFEALAKDALARADWSEQPSELSQHLRKRTPHAPQLDRLTAMKSSRPAIGRTALPQIVQLELDAMRTGPR